MPFRLLATVILMTHFGYLAYLVAGGFLAWRWPRTIWLHVAAAAWGLLVVAASLTCPLTAAENWARRRAGQATGDVGFIDRYIEGVLYPQQHAGVMRALAGVVVVVSWLGYAALAARRHGGSRRRVVG